MPGLGRYSCSSYEMVGDESSWFEQSIAVNSQGSQDYSTLTRKTDRDLRIPLRVLIESSVLVSFRSSNLVSSHTQICSADADTSRRHCLGGAENVSSESSRDHVACLSPVGEVAITLASSGVPPCGAGRPTHARSHALSGRSHAFDWIAFASFFVVHRSQDFRVVVHDRRGSVAATFH